jgi:hypothetical protein
LVPCSIATFCCSVIWPISWAIRVDVAAVEFIHGQVPGAGCEGGGGIVAVTPPTVYTSNSLSA